MKIKQVSVRVEMLNMKQKQRNNLGSSTSLKRETSCYFYNVRRNTWKTKD